MVVFYRSYSGVYMVLFDRRLQSVCVHVSPCHMFFTDIYIYSLPASHLLLLRSLLSDLLAAALLAVDKLGIFLFVVALQILADFNHFHCLLFSMISDCLEPSATTSSCFLHWFLAEGFSDKIGKSASPDETCVLSS